MFSLDHFFGDCRLPLRWLPSQLPFQLPSQLPSNAMALTGTHGRKAPCGPTTRRLGQESRNAYWAHSAAAEDRRNQRSRWTPSHAWPRSESICVHESVRHWPHFHVLQYPNQCWRGHKPQDCRKGSRRARRHGCGVCNEGRQQHAEDRVRGTLVGAKKHLVFGVGSRPSGEPTKCRPHCRCFQSPCGLIRRSI